MLKFSTTVLRFGGIRNVCLSLFSSFCTPVSFHSLVVSRNVIFSCRKTSQEIYILAYHSSFGKSSWQMCFFWSSCCECPCMHLLPSLSPSPAWLWFLLGAKGLVVFPSSVLLFIPVVRLTAWLEHLPLFHFLWGHLMRHAASP